MVYQNNLYKNTLDNLRDSYVIQGLLIVFTLYILMKKYNPRLIFESTFTAIILLTFQLTLNGIILASAKNYLYLLGALGLVGIIQLLILLLDISRMVVQ